MQLIVCAAPSYLRKYGSPKTLSQLDTHRCSAFRRPSDGKVVPWQVKIGENVVEKHINPAFSTNDEGFELRAVLAGEVIGHLAVPTAAKYIREGSLVPLLIEHMVDNLALYVYYGSRASQPARVRCFIDLVIERLANSKEFVLSDNELTKAHTKVFNQL